MNKYTLALLLSIALGASIVAADRAAGEFLSPAQVLAQADPLPDELESTREWVTEHSSTLKSLALPEMEAHSDWQAYQQAISTGLRLSRLSSLSDGNYVFSAADHGTVVRLAGASNTMRSRASSAGIDSGPTQNMCDIEKGRAIGYKADVLQQATRNAQPVHQHTSMLAYHLMMKRRSLDRAKVRPVATYAIQSGDGTEFCDENYVIVQPDISSTVLVSALDERERRDVVDRGLLEPLADMVDAGAWNLNADNLWYNEQNGNFYVTDLEGPNNEGWGPNAGTNPRWGRAVFSYDGDGTSCHQWKWEHNIRCGYDSAKGMLPNDLHAKWDSLKVERSPKED